MTIQKCSRPKEHKAHAIDDWYTIICPGNPPTEVKHLEERWQNGVGLSEYLPGNVQHLISPIVGMLRMDLEDGKLTSDKALRYYLRRLETTLLLARDQEEKDHQDV